MGWRCRTVVSSAGIWRNLFIFRTFTLHFGKHTFKSLHCLHHVLFSLLQDVAQFKVKITKLEEASLWFYSQVWSTWTLTHWSCPVLSHVPSAWFLPPYPRCPLISHSCLTATPELDLDNPHNWILNPPSGRTDAVLLPLWYVWRPCQSHHVYAEVPCHTFSLSTHVQM